MSTHDSSDAQSSPPKQPRGRRQTPRRGIRVVCRRGEAGLGANIALTLLDLSEDGAGLLLSEVVRAGEQLTLRLALAGPGQPLRQAGVVAWVVPTVGGACCAGVRFSKRLNEDDFSRLARP